jgi:hypothetical protein
MEKDLNDPNRRPAWTWDNYVSLGSDTRTPRWRRQCRRVHQQEGDEHIQPLLPGNHPLLVSVGAFNTHAFYAFQNQAQGHGQPPPHGHAMSAQQMEKLTHRLQTQAALMQARNLTRRAVEQLMFICSMEPGNKASQNQLDLEQADLRKLQQQVEDGQTGIVQWLTKGVPDDPLPVPAPVVMQAIDAMLLAFNRRVDAQLQLWDRRTAISGLGGLVLLANGLRFLNWAFNVENETGERREPYGTVGWFLVGISMVVLLYVVRTAQPRQ